MTPAEKFLHLPSVKCFPWHVGEAVSFVCLSVGQSVNAQCDTELSELAEGQFLHPRNVVNEGDIVNTRILSISGQKRRLALSLRIK